ncbi:MAG: hypothetical protein JWM21_3709 [Acidobacteria bacterium]|nr:hypothetical protein [Acidobacteriota bacterium]
MSEERMSDPNEESAAIDPPGNTGPEESANLDSALSAEGDGAIDPPGNT